jgi:hypothetical protein
MNYQLDTMARQSCRVVATAASVGSPEIVVFNDTEHAVVKVAHVEDCCPYIIGDYATLDAAAAHFEHDCGKLTALSLDRRPVARWYKDAVLMLMHIDAAPVFRSKTILGVTRGSVYTLVYIDGVWRLTTPTDIWMKMNSDML